MPMIFYVPLSEATVATVTGDAFKSKLHSFLLRYYEDY
jgi:hypothetical protein